MPGRSEQVVSSIKLRLNVLTGIVLLLCVILTATAGFVYLKAHTTEHALCALRGDLQRRNIEGAQFLKDHPNGFAGISPSAIKITISNQTRTVEALRSLSC